MKNGFRFPKATVVFMSLILLAILWGIQKAGTIQARYDVTETVWPSLPLSIAYSAIAVALLAVVIWAVLFALKRAGVHRLENLEP